MCGIRCGKSAQVGVCGHTNSSEAARIALSQEQPPKMNGSMGKRMSTRDNVYKVYASKIQPKAPTGAINSMDPEIVKSLPKLIPVRTNDYNLAKKCLIHLRPLQWKYSIYHIWLGCLYNNDVSFPEIVDSLTGILHPKTLRLLTERDIFIPYYQGSDGVMKASGSCFLVLTASALKDLETRILRTKAHMFNVPIQMFFRAVNHEPILILTVAFPDLVSSILPKLLRPPKDQSIRITSGASHNSAQNGTNRKVRNETPVEGQRGTKAKVVAQAVSGSSTENSTPGPSAGPSSSKGTKMAANFNNPANSIKSKIKSSQRLNDVLVSEEKFEETLRRMASLDVERGEYVGNVLPELKKHGDIVIKIENLPAKFSVSQLNLMFGICCVKNEQVRCITVPATRKKPATMTLVVVMSSADKDSSRILCKNKSFSPTGLQLAISRTDFKGLEQFLGEHKDKVRELDKDNQALPAREPIGYGPNPIPAVKSGAWEIYLPASR